MLNLNRAAVATFFASLASTYAFRDCTVEPDEYADPKLEELLCGDKHTRCKAGQIPVAIDFSEVPHKDYVLELDVKVEGYEGKKIQVNALGNIFNDKYRAYTPDMQGDWPNQGVGWTNLEDGKGAARVMDTATPGADLDLGTPNEDFEGPGIGIGGGIGAAGENSIYLGKAMFVQENAKQKVDDTRFGGQILFDFWDVMNEITITHVGLLDIESPEEDGTQLNTLTTATYETQIALVEGLNDNGFLEVAPGDAGQPMAYLRVKFIGSGAVTHLKGCLNEPPFECKGTGDHDHIDENCNEHEPVCVDEHWNPVPNHVKGVACVPFTYCKNTEKHGIDKGCTKEKPLCADKMGEEVGWWMRGVKCLPPKEYPCKNTSKHGVDQGCTKWDPHCVDHDGNHVGWHKHGDKCIGGSKSTSKSSKSKDSKSSKSKDGSKSSKSKDGSKSSKSKDGSKSSKSKDGSKSSKSKDGSKSSKSKDGSKSSKSKDGAKSSKSKDGSKSSKSKDGAKSSKSKDGAKSSKSKDGSKSGSKSGSKFGAKDGSKSNSIKPKSHYLR